LDKALLKELQVKTNKLVVEELRKKALPWESITDEYITSSDFLHMLGLKWQNHKAREISYFFRVFCVRDNDSSLMPDYIRDIFVDGTVRMKLIKYRARGPIEFGYRIPVKYIKDKYLPAIQKIISLRKNTNVIKPHTLKKLELLSISRNIPVSELIDQIVSKEFSLIKQGPTAT